MTTSDYSTPLLAEGGSQIPPRGEFIDVWDDVFHSNCQGRCAIGEVSGTVSTMFFSPKCRSRGWLIVGFAGFVWLSLFTGSALTASAAAVNLPADSARPPAPPSRSVSANSQGQANSLGRANSLGQADSHESPVGSGPGYIEPYTISMWPEGVQWQPPLSLPMVVTREFAPPAKRWLPGHRGVDIAAPAGSPVRSPVSGVVTFAGYVVNRPVLTIQHPNGFKSSLEPVRSHVGRGSVVVQGQVIGHTVAAETCPDCLHWGVRNTTGVYVDPLAVPVVRPAILLPWHVGGRTITRRLT